MTQYSKHMRPCSICGHLPKWELFTNEHAGVGLSHSCPDDCLIRFNYVGEGEADLGDFPGSETLRLRLRPIINHWEEENEAAHKRYLVLLRALE